MKYILLATIVLLILLPSFINAQDDGTQSFINCDTELTHRYVQGYHVDNNWFDAEYEEMSAFVVETYRAFERFRTEKCGELAFYLTRHSLYDINYTVWSADDVATLYEGIYDEVGGGYISDYSCAFDMMSTYFEFSRAIERTTNVQDLIDVMIEMWRNAVLIAGDRSCDDNALLELTRITIDFSNADVRDSNVIEPVVLRSIYEEVRQHLED